MPDPSSHPSTSPIDGLAASCSSAMGAVSAGAAVIGPANTTRWNPDLNNGQGGHEFFHAFADGTQGWGPLSGIPGVTAPNPRPTTPPALKPYNDPRHPYRPFDPNIEPLIQEQVDIPSETERLFRDCVKIVEAHLTDQLANTIRDNNKSNQPLSLLIAHAAVESTLGTALEGFDGELGLFQLKPSTARGLNLEKFTNLQLRNDFALNTRLGTTYLQRQIDAFGGDIRSGLGAYKQGTKSVREAGLTPRSQIYADAIQKCAKELKR